MKIKTYGSWFKEKGCVLSFYRGKRIATRTTPTAQLIRFIYIHFRFVHKKINVAYITVRNALQIIS